MASSGNISIHAQNIMPIIKKWLYSDKDIFIRELVANGCDAVAKRKIADPDAEVEYRVTVEADEDKGELRFIDNGVGMTAEEVDKYINQVAFSGAEEFLKQYGDEKNPKGGIIGHFGLGFYSAFMVAKKVTLESLSWKKGASGVIWTCEVNPEFEMGPCDKAERGTVITLYLDDEAAKDYGTKGKIQQLLDKYCKFMPVPVVFGKEQEWKDGKYVDTDKDNVINKIEPLWTRKPSELKEEDYMKFYRDLYPMKEDPLFYIHLNVDYPFNLTGILYFPKIKDRMAIEKNNIQLYCNQMFVTDHVENIVPDFLTLLHGVIDSPDIPLNVSRSYLQADENVKKISTYITKKVADRLEEIFKNEREAWEKKWDNLKLFIEYGMLSDEKFCERALKFALLKNTDGKYFSLEDYRKAIAENQTDKDKKVVYLYATDTDEQYAFIEAAKNKGYDVLLMDCELDSHYVNLLEQKIPDTKFARVDSDTIDNLIPKNEKVKPEMAQSDKDDLSAMFKAVLPKGNDYFVEADNLGENAAPVVITRNEFMRRYREMSAMGGGMNFYGNMPESFNITVNFENPVMAGIVTDAKSKITPMQELPAEPGKDASEDEKKRINDERQAIKDAHQAVVDEYASGNDILKQVIDLALLSNGLLKGKALFDFIARSEKVIAEAARK